ncbi:MAG: hypothetical protein M1491_09675 [Deltaproteobacteria bacterium]|nr:hypothetical protein [Deltaproteobacteria bacterium]MCL5277431.1 hypothetical protein [Deltaproteobacteria bacterium]
MLKKNAYGLAWGLLTGVGLFLVTNYIVLLHHGGGTLVKIDQVYRGYSITFGGSLLGLIYGFVTGYIVGWFMALFYNIFA